MVILEIVGIKVFFHTYMMSTVKYFFCFAVNNDKSSNLDYVDYPNYSYCISDVTSNNQK